MSDRIEITDFSAPELDIYARLPENQLLHYCEPERGIFIAESPKVIGRALDGGCEPVSVLVEKGQTDRETEEIIGRCGEVPVFTAELSVISKLTGFPLTRGLLCAMRRPKLRSVSQICEGARRIAVLEQVMNPTNVGAVFRSAAALNIDGILLTAGCSDPLYRRAVRVSMGTVFQVPWTYFDRNTPWPGEGMKCLRNMGFQTAAMALTDDSIRIDAPCLEKADRLAIVLGTEGDGLAAETIADCDYTIRIPMAHGVDSLNVAAASAVAFWQLAGRQQTQGHFGKEGNYGAEAGNRK